MIRYTNSFIISLLLHISLVIIVFYGYTNINISPTKKEVKVKLNLSYIVEKKPQVVPIKKIKKLKKKESPKKILPKVNPLKKQIKKKIIKKTIPVKKTPIVKKEISPKVNPFGKKVEPVKEIVKKVKPIDDIFVKEIKTISVESSEEKEKRLQTQYIDNNIDKIVKLLKENLYYPRSARRRGIVGEVIVEFKLSTDSKAHFVNIISSQSKILSRAAIQTIENLSGSFPKPNEELTIQIPINYNLK